MRIMEQLMKFCLSPLRHKFVIVFIIVPLEYRITISLRTTCMDYSFYNERQISQEIYQQ